MARYLAAVLALTLTACASADGAGGPAPDEVVLVVESTGGCAQMGPNCIRLVVFGDGTVEAHRLISEETQLVGLGSIDRELVVAVHEAVLATDFTTLRQRLPAGECRGCYDGIDTTMTFRPNLDPQVFASVDVELDPSEPLFAAAWAVADAANAAIEVPIVTR
jgi:hypothetical protein